MTTPQHFPIADNPGVDPSISTNLFFVTYLPRLSTSGLLDQSNFRLARDSVTITKVPETTACRVLPSAGGKVKLPAEEAGHHHD